MTSRLFIGIVAATMCLAGCSMMEQYHFPQTQDKVPVNVIVAFSEAYPNDTIKYITEQKMYNGKKQYKFTVADSKNVERTVAITEDGQAVPHPL